MSSYSPLCPPASGIGLGRDNSCGLTREAAQGSELTPATSGAQQAAERQKQLGAVLNGSEKLVTRKAVAC